MANSNGRITAPVRVTDVKTVLGVNNNNVGYLCSNKHGRINKWAKYKPVQIASVAPDRSGKWYQGKDKNCGLNIARVSSPENAHSDWSYKPPAGGANDPFRLLDFNGYNHNSVPFLYITHSADVSIDLRLQQGINWNLYDLVNVGGTYINNLTRNDFSGALPDINNCYLCLFMKSSTGAAYIMTTTSRIGLNNGSSHNLYLDGTKIPTDYLGLTWTGHLCLSTRQYDFQYVGGNLDAAFYSLPTVKDNKNPISIRVIRSTAPLPYMKVTQVAPVAFNAKNSFDKLSDINKHVGGASTLYTPRGLLFKCEIINERDTTYGFSYLDEDIVLRARNANGEMVKSKFEWYNENQQVDLRPMSISPKSTKVFYYHAFDVVPYLGAEDGTRWHMLLDFQIRSTDYYYVGYQNEITVEYDKSLIVE